MSQDILHHLRCIPRDTIENILKGIGQMLSSKITTWGKEEAWVYIYNKEERVSYFLDFISHLESVDEDKF